MKKVEEIGICPNCGCSIFIFKTKNYKRFAKCEICGFSYALPKSGKISNSSEICPKRKLPVLIINKKDQKAYFWSDGPCFTCIDYDKCNIIKEMKLEFEQIGEYGF